MISPTKHILKIVLECCKVAYLKQFFANREKVFDAQKRCFLYSETLLIRRQEILIRRILLFPHFEKVSGFIEV